MSGLSTAARTTRPIRVKRSRQKMAANMAIAVAPISTRKKGYCTAPIEKAAKRYLDDRYIDALLMPEGAAAGEADCVATLDRYAGRLARALATVVNVLDPDVIVLGGGMSNLDRLYADVPRLWLPHVFSDHVSTRLAKAVHGDSSGVRGAAWLWPA